MSKKNGIVPEECRYIPACFESEGTELLSDKQTNGADIQHNSLAGGLAWPGLPWLHGPEFFLKTLGLFDYLL